MGTSIGCLVGLHSYKVVNVIKGVKIWKCQDCSKVKKPTGGNQNVGRS